ncbi:MAG: DUF2299 family protein [Candidatus Hermodarchaeota archaeon]
MSIISTNIEKLIKEYLLEEGILKERLNNPNFDFGFIFSFPPGGIRTQNMSIYKPKDRNSIFITIRYQIAEEKVKILSSLKEDQKLLVLEDLRKLFLIKEVLYAIDIQKMIVEIHEQFYPQKDGIIPKDVIFKKMLTVFYSYIYSNILIDERCKGKDKAMDTSAFSIFS